MSKKNTYDLIEELICENRDLIDLVKDLIKIAYKDDERKKNFIQCEFENGVDMPREYGGCLSLNSMEYRYKLILKNKEKNDEED